MSKKLNSVRDALGRDPAHPFPARMAPGIALEALAPRRGRRLRVLDPMMGSGTVIAVARSCGHECVGIDIDPLAVLISKAWTMSIDRQKLQVVAVGVLQRAKEHCSKLGVGAAYPLRCDRETKKFIRYWFDPTSRRQLTSLAKSISGVRDIKMRTALWCAFSRLIITKNAGASLAMDLSHSRPHKVFEVAPVQPFEKFLLAVNHVAKSCISHKSKDRGPSPVLREGDARRLPIKTSSVDLVLTSPPYLNAIDYLRCSKFTLVWMGYSVKELGKLRSTSVGSEVGRKLDENSAYISKVVQKLNLKRKLSQRHTAILHRFVDDMQQALVEAARVLVPGGKAIYVVGENTIRGTYIKNSEIIAAVARKAGLRLNQKTSRLLPNGRRYLPPPTSRDGNAAMNSRMRREVVLTFQKPKPRKLNIP